MKYVGSYWARDARELDLLHEMDVQLDGVWVVVWEGQDVDIDWPIGEPILDRDRMLGQETAGIGEDFALVLIEGGTDFDTDHVVETVYGEMSAVKICHAIT